jgi:hypothetical protein
MHGGGGDPKACRRLLDVDQRGLRRRAGRLATRNLPVAPEIADPPAVKRCPVAVLRPWRLRIPAMVASG